jgi:hypothetical protein
MLHDRKPRLSCDLERNIEGATLRTASVAPHPHLDARVQIEVGLRKTGLRPCL